MCSHAAFVRTLPQDGPIPLWFHSDFVQILGVDGPDDSVLVCALDELSRHVRKVRTAHNTRRSDSKHRPLRLLK